MLKVALNTITLTHYFLTIHSLLGIFIDTMYIVFLYIGFIFIFIQTISSDVHVVNGIIKIICIDI